MEKNKVIYLDADGYQSFLDELAQLEERLFEFRKQNADVFNNCVNREENAFEEAVREEYRIVGLIAQQREQLKRIIIISNNTEENLVSINDFVKISMLFETEEEEMIVKLVATPDADFEAEIPEVSINSPLGASIYGKMIGSEASYIVDGTESKITVINKSKSLDEIINNNLVLKRENKTE